MTFTFLQLSDLHLGAPCGWLPPERRELRRREQHRVLERAVDRAIELRVAAILVPGDVFDREGVDASTLAFAVHAFARLGCPPVFIAPGNHDPWSPASPYWSARLLAARGWSWPANVHVFGTAEWSMRPLDDTPVRVWGRCATNAVEATDRPLDETLLAPVRAADPALVHVGLFHGSREGHLPPGQKLTAPFADSEALGSPFGYLAVGHYHLPSALDDGGRTRLAYAGSAIALEVGELGAHGALVVEITWDGATTTATTRPEPLDPRRVHALEVEVTGASSADQVDRRILETMDAAGVGGDDIARVRLAGRLIRGVRYAEPGPELAARVFHLRVDAGSLRPDYDLDAYRTEDPRTTEHRFVRTLLDDIDREQDPSRRATLERALYYGLDAFRLHDVAPSYEEIEG